MDEGAVLAGHDFATVPPPPDPADGTAPVAAFDDETGPAWMADNWIGLGILKRLEINLLTYVIDSSINNIGVAINQLVWHNVNPSFWRIDW